MRGPRPPAIELSGEERQGLEALLRRHTTPKQVALHARLILAVAVGLNNAQVARQEGVEVEAARRWRGRWLGLRPIALADLSVEEWLADAPRSGAPARITAEHGCRIVALDCEAPGRSASGPAARSPTRPSRGASWRGCRPAPPGGCSKRGPPAAPHPLLADPARGRGVRRRGGRRVRAVPGRAAPDGAGGAGYEYR